MAKYVQFSVFLLLLQRSNAFIFCLFVVVGGVLFIFSLFGFLELNFLVCMLFKMKVIYIKHDNRAIWASYRIVDFFSFGRSSKVWNIIY